MLSSRCPRRSPTSPSSNKASSTVSCSALRRRPCATIAATRPIWAREIGVLTVLHTWGQTCSIIRTYIARPRRRDLAGQHRWIACRPGFFLPVGFCPACFRGLFLHYLDKAFAAAGCAFSPPCCPCRNAPAFLRYLARVRTAEWVVFAKPPFAGPQQVLGYVGRYTHRVAISNSRLSASTTARSASAGRTIATRQSPRTMTLYG